MLQYELYGGYFGLVDKIRIKYFQPNTNCMYMVRKMLYLYSCGGIKRLCSKRIYLSLLRKYNCCIFSHAIIGRGLKIEHPVGIVIGAVEIGKEFIIYQNCTIGRSNGKTPVIGDHVCVYSNSVVVGGIHVADHVTIGAQSLVIRDITESGIYAGNPLRKIK